MNLDLIGKIIDDTLGDLINDVEDSQRSKGLRKSGKTAASLRKEVTSDQDTISGKLFGSELLVIQEKGRGPNASGKPSRLMVEQIAAWVALTGLSISPWAVATKIARDGITVPNRHNPGRVLSEPLDKERVKQMMVARVKDAFLKDLKSSLFQ